VIVDSDSSERGGAEIVRDDEKPLNGYSSTCHRQVQNREKKDKMYSAVAGATGNDGSEQAKSNLVLYEFSVLQNRLLP
jgi:hypothetical protein